MAKQIAIVGGGITGLVAAYILGKAGCRVTIFERSNHLGGLAAGFPLYDTYLEMAYHHIFSTDKDIIQLVDELGLKEYLEWHKGSIGIYCLQTLYPFVSPLDLLLFKPLSLIDRVRVGLVVFYLQHTHQWHRFKTKAAHSWMKKWSGAAGYEVIWKPLLKGKFHHYYENISMAWLWARIHTRANSRNEGIANETLGYFRGGFHVLVDKLCKIINDQGACVYTGKKINSVTYDQKKQMVHIQTDENHYFDEIICTTPSYIFADIVKDAGVTEQYLTQLRSIVYLHAICIIFTTEQSLSPYYWNNINDTESPFLAFIQHTNLVPKVRYGDKHVYYMGSYLPDGHDYFAMTDEKLYQVYFDYLKKVFPHFDDSKVEKKYIFRLKNAQHVVDTTYDRRIPTYRTELPHVYLANFSQIYPEDRGTNFAVRQGKEVAQLLLEQLS